MDRGILGNQKQLKVISLVLGMVFALVLFPSNAKAIILGVFTFLILSLVVRQNLKMDKEFFIFHSIFYLSVLFTLIYSENIPYAVNKLQTMSPLLVFPFLFSFFTNRFRGIILKNLNTYLLIYILSVFLFNTIVFLFFGLNRFSWEDTLRHLPEIVDVGLGKFSIHPIYISMHICMAILFSTVIFLKTSRKKVRIGLLFINFILAFFLLIFARKGPILAFFVTGISSLVFFAKRSNRKWIIVLFLVLLGVVFIVPNTRNRFKELYVSQELNQKNKTSTLIRTAIYQEVFQLIKRSPIFGYGIGDYNDRLKQSYKEKELTFLTQQNFNAHNQYLSAWLIGGVFSFLALLFLLGRALVLSVKHSNYWLFMTVVFYGLVMLTENILERENGVVFFAFFLSYFSLLNKDEIKRNRRVLMIGPFPKPVSGVSLANKNVFKILEESQSFCVDFINTSFSQFEENLGVFSIKKTLSSLSKNLYLYKIIGSDIVYITPGQTFFGVIKYSPFILLSSWLNKELIFHIHGNHLRNEYDSLSASRKKIFHYLLSKGSKGIVLSESLRRNLSPFLNSKDIFVIPNFAEDYLIDSNIKSNFTELRIVFLSNLMKEKGILNLLDSLKKLESTGIPYSAKLAGHIDPKTKKEIFDAVKDLKNTVYLGVVEGMEKKGMLDWGNVFVLPTFYKMEGQPISILEAMATENVIITTKIDGIKEIVKQNENGFFIDHVNITTNLTEVLIGLSENKELIKEISLNNKARFMNNFTVDLFKQRVLQTLKN